MPLSRTDNGTSRAPTEVGNRATCHCRSDAFREVGVRVRAYVLGVGFRG